MFYCSRKKYPTRAPSEKKISNTKCYQILRVHFPNIVHEYRDLRTFSYNIHKIQHLKTSQKKHDRRPVPQKKYHKTNSGVAFRVYEL